MPSVLNTLSLYLACFYPNCICGHLFSRQKECSNTTSFRKPLLHTHAHRNPPSGPQPTICTSPLLHCTFRLVQELVIYVFVSPTEQ